MQDLSPSEHFGMVFQKTSLENYSLDFNLCCVASKYVLGAIKIGVISWPQFILIRLDCAFHTLALSLNIGTSMEP